MQVIHAQQVSDESVGWFTASRHLAAQRCSRFAMSLLLVERFKVNMKEKGKNNSCAFQKYSNPLNFLTLTHVIGFIWTFVKYLKKQFKQWYA